MLDRVRSKEVYGIYVEYSDVKLGGVLGGFQYTGVSSTIKLSSKGDILFIL